MILHVQTCVAKGLFLLVPKSDNFPETSMILPPHLSKSKTRSNISINLTWLRTQNFSAIFCKQLSELASTETAIHKWPKKSCYETFLEIFAVEPFTIKTVLKIDKNTNIFARIVKNFQGSYFSKYLQFTISCQLSLSSDTKVKLAVEFDVIYWGGKSTAESWECTVKKKEGYRISVFDSQIQLLNHTEIDTCLDWCIDQDYMGLCIQLKKKSKTAGNVLILIDNWKNSITLESQIIVPPDC